MLDWQAYGRWAGGHHLTSVLIHAAAVVGLFLVLRRMTGRLWPSAMVAAAFAIHPLRAKSVAWVAERKDVLSGLFFVLTLWAYVAYAGQELLARSEELQEAVELQRPAQQVDPLRGWTLFAFHDRIQRKLEFIQQVPRSLGLRPGRLVPRWGRPGDCACIVRPARW